MASLIASLRQISRAGFLGKLVRLPFALLPRNRALPIPFGKLRGYRWVVGSSFLSCWLGLLEYEKQKEFVKLVKGGDIVFDIGANVGFYTLLASALVGDAGHVYAFEPLPRNIGLLQRHVAVNGLTNVTIVEGAVSNREGTARFDASVLPEMAHLSDSGGIPVKVFTLDSLAGAGVVGAPTLLKIDVEGAEADVIRGGRSVLQQHHPIILLATHGPEVHAECLELLRSLEYEAQPLDGKPIAESTELLCTSVKSH